MCPELTPSFHGSMARCLPRLHSDLLCSDLLRSALLRTTSFLSPSCLLRREWHRLLPTYAAAPLRSFVLLLARAPCRFGDFNARQLLFSRLSSLSPLAPLPSPPSVPCLLFRRARAFPFSSATYFPGQQVFFHHRFSSRTYERCVRDRQLRCDYRAAITHCDAYVKVLRAWLLQISIACICKKFSSEIYWKRYKFM